MPAQWQYKMFVGSKEHSDLTDQQLIGKYKQSENKEWVGILFMRYTHLVYSVCYKYLKDEDEAKDFTMQVFEQLLGKLLEHEVSNFKGWLHMVVKNHCLMHLRKVKSIRGHQKKYKEITPAHVESDFDEHPNIEFEKEAKIRNLELAMNDLNQKQKTCISLFYLQKLSYQEVADRTGFTLKEVKSYIQNGKRNLKIILTKLYEQQG